mmetsp:Transcript_18697/g.2562  ORF Transcript_18697/g.2562 Transcript_18697/m.2562 type:complete len:82 (+) Transcript_18697:138-383(+)
MLLKIKEVPEGGEINSQEQATPRLNLYMDSELYQPPTKSKDGKNVGMLLAIILVVLVIIFSVGLHLSYKKTQRINLGIANL